LQNPVRRQASVTLPDSRPFEYPDPYGIERKNQKKVVLILLLWQAGCKLLRVSSADRAKIVPIHPSRPRNLQVNLYNKFPFPYETEQLKKVENNWY
jgi:hypothetical protein